jgi:predicted AAA+ superfamily ATPase
MDDDDLIELIRDFHDREMPELVPRELDVKLPKAKKCVSVIGPRRAGKSSLLFSLVQRLRESGEGEHTLYVNLEDDRLYPPTTEVLDRVFRLYRQVYPLSRGSETHLFLDEVQTVDGWERWVRRLVDTGEVRVYITGSSSRLLRDEVATTMRGRCISYTLLPYSFREFLTARGVEVPRHLSSTDRDRLATELREYVTIGGFPEVTTEDDLDVKLRTLGEYVDVMLLRDVVERHHLANIMVLRMLFGRMLSSVSSTFSVHRFHKDLRSQNISVSKNTLYDYFSHLEDALVILALRRYSPSLKEVQQSLPKVYPVDNGFIAHARGGPADEMGALMEASVAMHLYRMTCSDPALSLFYWSKQGSGEVDFVLRRGSGTQSLVQSCYDATDPFTRRRELGALAVASRELGCDDLTMVTWNEGGSEEIDGMPVRIVPLWEWLLDTR